MNYPAFLQVLSLHGSDVATGYLARTPALPTFSCYHHSQTVLLALGKFGMDVVMFSLKMFCYQTEKIGCFCHSFGD